MTNPYGAPGQQPYPGPPQQPMPPQQPGQPPAGVGPYGPQPGPQPQQPAPPMQQPPMGSGGPAPMGQQAPPPQPGMGRVMLDTSYMPLEFLLALFKPEITINGQPYPVAQWGQNVIDLPPGQHQIQVHVNYMWKFGHAQAVVPVNDGQQVAVYYRAPAVTLGEGAIGPGPQSTPKMGVAVACMVVPVVFAIIIVLLSAL